MHSENVRKFCYLEDMLSGGGGASSASVARVGCAWGKFKELSGTRKEVALKPKGMVYVRSAMICGSEVYPMTVELNNRLVRTVMWMLQWMCGKDEGDWEKRCLLVEVDGARG